MEKRTKKQLDEDTEDILCKMRENLFKYFIQYANLSDSQDKSYRTIEKETGISRNTVSNLVNLKCIPQIPTIIKLALYYNLNLNDIFSQNLIDYNVNEIPKEHNKLSPKEELEIKVKACGYTEDEQKAILNVIKLINQKYKNT